MSGPSLQELRSELAAIDAECVTLLAKRQEVARRVGAHKRARSLATLDTRREADVVATAARLGREAGLPEEEVRSIFWHVVAMSRRAQQDDAT